MIYLDKYRLISINTINYIIHKLISSMADQKLPERSDGMGSEQKIPDVWRNNLSLLLLGRTGVDGNIVNAIENELYTKYKSDPQLYKSQCIRIGMNLAQNGKYIIDNYKSDASQIVSLTDSDLARGTIIEEEDLIEKEKIKNYNALVQAANDQFKVQEGKGLVVCHKCGKNMSKLDLQTSSADEGMSRFFRCSCGTRFKMR